MDDPSIVHDYDALKRREYYLKTRQLKGRETSNAVKKPALRPKPVIKLPSMTRQQRQAERRRQLEAQVDALKARLATLKAALAELVKAAKARSGVKETKPQGSKPSNQKSTGKAGDKKQTAAQKAEAAKNAKDYYEKNKDQLLADEVKSLNEKIKSIQERIAKMRKASSVEATKLKSK